MQEEQNFCVVVALCFQVVHVCVLLCVRVCICECVLHLSSLHSISNQWTEFCQTLVDGVAEETDEGTRF